MFRRAPGAFAAVEPRGAGGNRRPGSPATATPSSVGALRLGGPGANASAATPRDGGGAVTVTRPRPRRGTEVGWSGRGGGTTTTTTTRRDDDDDAFGGVVANDDDVAVDDACGRSVYGQAVSTVVGLQLDASVTRTPSFVTNRDSMMTLEDVEVLQRKKKRRRKQRRGLTTTLTRVPTGTTEEPASTSGRVISVSADGTEAERAFHSVHDLVHFAILSQPGHQASLRLIYSICQRAGRIASKHGGGSRLITANEHWKSQIRHALYTSPRFKRIGSDDWGVTAGHLNSPDTTVVYVSKEEREKEAHSALGVKMPSSPSKRRRASSQSRSQPRSRVQAQPRTALSARRTGSVTQRVPKTSAQNDGGNRSSAEPESEPMTMMESGKLLKSMRSMSSNSAFSSEHALESIVRAGLSKQGGAANASPPRGAPRSRSVSPEPRSSSTLVVVAGLLEHDQKVLPRDFRRNRRKPAGGGHHAAMPSDTDCHEPCTLSVKLEQYH